MYPDQVDGGTIIYHPPPPVALIDEVSHECWLLSVVNKRSLLCKRAAGHLLHYVHLSKRNKKKTAETTCQKRE